MKSLLLICLLLLISLPAQGAGIGVSPSKLDLHVPRGGSTSVEMVASNPAADVQLFEVYPDEFAENISVSPASFTLESGARKSVIVTVSSHAVPQDTVVKTLISVIARPLVESRFQADTGVKIPLTANIVVGKATASAWPRWIFWVYAAAVVLAFALWQLYLRRKPAQA